MEFNVLAAVVAGVLSLFVLGGLWYSPACFGRAWARAAGMPFPETPDGKKEGKHPGKVFALSAAYALLAALVFAWWLGPNPPLAAAVKAGGVVGIFVATCFGINYAFANRSALMWAIDAGYHVVQFLLFGLILGLWH
jgi:hypothetical protein